MVRDHFRDLTIENILVIQDFQSKDLKREFYCSVKNERGFDTRRAQLEEEGEEALLTPCGCFTLKARHASVTQAQ